MEDFREAARMRLEGPAPNDLASADITTQLEAVIRALRDRPGRIPVLPEVLSGELKLPIVENTDLLRRLMTNPKVEIIDGKYKYRPEIAFNDREDLMDHLSREVSGYPKSKIEDSYPGCWADVEDLRDNGDIIYIKCSTVNFSDVIFRRQFGVSLALPCQIEPSRNTDIVVTRGDLRNDVFRGDLIFINGRPYRVSRAVRTAGKGVDKFYGSKARLNNGGGDFSVAGICPHLIGAKTYTYDRPFSSTELPLDRKYDGDLPPAVDGKPGAFTISKMGASGRMRELWRASLGQDRETKFSFFNSVKFPESHEALREAMKQVGLSSTPGENAMPHEKKFKKSEPKKRKFSALASIRTNAHLEHTRLGAAVLRIQMEDHKKALAAAAKRK